MIQVLAKTLLQKAVDQMVHDLYFVALEGKYSLYFRTATERRFERELDLEQGQALIAHMKFLAGMNLGESRRVQLGACTYVLDKGEQRLRLSTVGDFHGQESLVIRLLHHQQSQLHFWNSEIFKSFIGGRGLYLFSGPVGSGKTSLMYKFAREHFKNQQVICIEDPVELVETEFLQLQVNKVIGNDYDALIKLSLRHRPDLLIVGEIRDSQTAKAVLRASLTGYTVFSTVHARSISGVITRLKELGLTDWELQSSLQRVIYQRLIAGRGLLVYEKEKFEEWQPDEWNGQIDQLLQLRTKKLSLAKQIKLVQLMNNLFKSGFHLSEIIDFLERSGLTEAYFISKMRAGLLNGQSFSGILAKLKFNEDIVTQLSLAESHGNVEYTLGLIEEKLRRILNIRKKLIQVATYPLVLLVFLIFIMLGLKNYLLPQLDENRGLATYVIQNLPTLFLGCLFSLLVFFYLGRYYWKKKLL